MDIWWQLQLWIRDFMRQEVQINLFGTRLEMGFLQFGILLGIISLTTAVLLNHKRAPMRMRTGGLTGFFTTVFVSPVIEELIFRLVLISVFTVLFDSVIIAVVLSAFLFGIGHLLYGNMRFVDSFVIGLLWGWAFVFVGLPITIIAHITHNFLASMMGG